MAKDYINLHLAIKEECFDIAYSFIQYYPFCGIEEKFDEIVICFEAEKWQPDFPSQLLEEMQSLDPQAQIIKTENIKEQNWNEEWEKNVQPIIVNDKIGIAPSWKINDLTQEMKIIINPKMSFGTGEHATTRLVCRLMENIVTPGSFWIDAGTGTGVLAILAKKFGAGRVLAFDNNEWSIDNAKENFELNNCPEIELMEADILEMTLPEAEGIAANLFRNLLLPSFDLFYKSLKNSKGTLLVSGILKYDREEIIEAAEKAGFRTIEAIGEEEWLAVHFQV